MSEVEGMKANQTKESNLPQRPKVAFLGKFPYQDGGIRIPASAPLNFTEVFDIGNGFEEGEGVYTVPYSGVYLINFQVFPYQSKDNLVDLKMNGNTLPLLATRYATNHRAAQPVSLNAMPRHATD
ncbi:hypothetical protein C0Q70_19713 [Pomacea canaliculata]|uniref:Uncharacterized protein n=1 Tax=Pomacea canaliculata TaxID=400727 RepID=A0A2T7NDH9_POMCA|nr:hypothetical protein C0Q70_19713 [Pomacea canaliculata]